MQKKITLNELADEELLIETEKLIMDERRLLLDVLQHLREIQKRKLFSEIGYTSLHDYAVRHLKYSDDQAARRIAAMRLITELPALALKVEQGELSLTTMAMAARFFKEEIDIDEPGAEDRNCRGDRWALDSRGGKKAHRKFG